MLTLDLLLTKAVNQSSNIVIGDHAGTAKYSMRVTTGKDDMVHVDVCGVLANCFPVETIAGTQTAIKIRVDSYTNAGTFLSTYVTPSIYSGDVSAVTGNVVSGAITNADNIGKKLTKAPFLPMYFRTLEGDGIASANKVFPCYLEG